MRKRRAEGCNKSTIHAHTAGHVQGQLYTSRKLPAHVTFECKASSHPSKREAHAWQGTHSVKLTQERSRSSTGNSKAWCTACGTSRAWLWLCRLLDSNPGFELPKQVLWLGHATRTQIHEGILCRPHCHTDRQAGRQAGRQAESSNQQGSSSQQPESNRDSCSQLAAAAVGARVHGSREAGLSVCRWSGTAESTRLAGG